MIASTALLTDLKRELRALEDDLRVRAEDQSTDWGKRLREEHRRAQARERTGLAWIEWRDGEVSQAAVAWIIATVFIRFAEDNDLLVGANQNGRPVTLPWIAAPGDGLERAVENETAFYAAGPTRTTRDWLQDAFRTLAELPAGRPLVDPRHSAVWHALISATASDRLLAFFRRTTPDGELVHDFSDPDLSTRFLGDLYQDLSDYAKKTFALLQTPLFIEEFILDQTLAPAIAEFGLTGLRLIDPACGSGHFLLGAFDRLTAAWAEAAPGMEKGEGVQRALDSINGVDLNPFATAIARFRLTVAAIKAAGIRTLTAAPAFKYHLAIGDSLLGGVDYQTTLDIGDDEQFEYEAEDLQEHRDLLKPGQYHVVVANPPYITVKDAVLNRRYRILYPTCHRKYGLSVPFAELLFRLARKAEGGSGAGYVGQITSNAFAKREFGKKLIEQFLSGSNLDTHVDLTHIIDTSGAFIPGHGTPTVILIGRRQKPTHAELRAVLGIRGEPTQPSDPASGLVWREIVEHIDDNTFDGTYVTIADVPRENFAAHPWSLSGGGASDLKDVIDTAGARFVGNESFRIGFFGVIGADDAFIVPKHVATQLEEPGAYRDLVLGDGVRDFAIRKTEPSFFPYDLLHDLQPLDRFPRNARRLWPYRTELGNRPTFGRLTYFEEGRPWYEWHQLPTDVDAHPFAITYAFVSTHNHFVLDREGRAFGRTAPVIKLPASASEDDHFAVLGVLNSSTACFWLKQVSFDRRLDGESWETFFEFTGTNIAAYPLPISFSGDLARRIDEQSAIVATNSPRTILATGGDGVALAEAHIRWDEARRTIVALQEELDWQIYVAYGLADASLAPDVVDVVPIEPNMRPFEVRLAREIDLGAEQSGWFLRHERAPETTGPTVGPGSWLALWEARYAAAESGFLRMLERPEYKRRWAGGAWDTLVGEAVTEALFDRLDEPANWRDPQGRPLVRSAAQLADDLRRDTRMRELLLIHSGSHDYDLTEEIAKLLAAEAVPGLAAMRYKASGLEKFRSWERTWELQRAEDRREGVIATVAPKYASADFLKPSYWSARGKLDVPKERFIALPGSRYPEDPTAAYGWAGWDHGERGQAIARFANEIARAGAADEQVIPLVATLIELEPWLKQWHDEIGTTGVSPAGAVAGIVAALLGRLSLGRDTIADWRPPTTTRGGRTSA